jgi:hypothetical protein
LAVFVAPHGEAMERAVCKDHVHDLHMD